MDPNLTDRLWAAAKQLDHAKQLLMAMTPAELARLKAAGILDEARKATAEVELLADWIKADLRK
jgi:hypothetical protein